MHLEITIALNYLLQNLYNKLPRRRVNLFGEELLHQLKQKYNNHWYPTNPVKGSAYRCLKTPTDPIISIAANEVNINLSDIIENLPTDLWIWIDPGEVSYRIGNGGQVKILWKGNGDNIWESMLHMEHLFDDDIIGGGDSGFYPIAVPNNQVPQPQPPIPLIAPTPQPQVPTTKPQPTMMTTAAFAQTKFGSTKLKTNNKRINSSATRQNMSPTEFSNYIKHKQQLQQLALATAAPPPPRPRSLSPNDLWSTGGLTPSNGSSFNINNHIDYYTPLFDPSSVWGSNMGHHGAGTPDQLLVS